MHKLIAVALTALFAANVALAAPEKAAAPAAVPATAAPAPTKATEATKPAAASGCEAKAVSKDGKPLHGAAKASSIKKCEGAGKPAEAAKPAAVDEAAAMALAKKNDCTKCHAVDKTKTGPSYKKIAAKYKEKKLGEKELIKQITESRKVKLEDGSEKDHKIIETKDSKELSNLAQWILSR